MNNNSFYPFAMLLIIFVAIYFMYGDAFSPQQVNFQAYRDQCVTYQTAPPGTYRKDEVQMLVNEIQYLLPDAPETLTDPVQQETKKCMLDLQERLSKNQIQ